MNENIWNLYNKLEQEYKNEDDIKLDLDNEDNFKLKEEKTKKIEKKKRIVF